MIEVGDLVRRMDRDGLWRVQRVEAGRALLSLVGHSWLSQGWASLDDLIRAEEGALA